MNALVHAHEKTGVLQITGGIHSAEKALALKAAVEDLPGVYATEFRWEGMRVHFDPQLAFEQQFYEAVKLAGFHASDFFVLNEN
ncbi:MAG TPA: hypothetical protein VK961_04935 [Chthoniobacter sp.]|nr:hypothetical protein [Chthoniobacter sp.]